MTMAASPATVFTQVNDYHNWEAWSPWAKLDPNAKTTFEGPPTGTGATFTWDGNDKVGSGRQTILESKPDALIKIRLEFEKPMKDVCTAQFDFKPQDDKTLVTWSMYGKTNFVGKIFCLFMNMDKMVGGDFEKGLTSLKAIVEAPPKSAEPSKTEPPTKTES